MLIEDPSSPWLLQEDNDPKHTSKNAAIWKDRNNVARLPWPSSSPDLNPIENVWVLMKVKVAQKNPQSIPALKKIIKDVWKEFDKTYAENLVASIKNRIFACIEAEGDYILY